MEKFKKQNALINAFTSDKVAYKEVHHDLLNLFMGIIQKQYENVSKNINTINISKELICKYANIAKTKTIFPYLQDLAHIQYKLNEKDIQRINKASDYKVKKGFFTFITSAQEIVSSDKREISYKIEFNPKLFNFLLDKQYCLDYGNYTTIKNNDISSLNSKYQKIIGELILSNKYKKEFSFSYEYLKDKFNITNKPNGYLMDILKLHLPKLQDKFMDFDYEFHKRDKLISIVLK